MDLTWSLYFPLILRGVAYAIVVGVGAASWRAAATTPAPSGCATPASCSCWRRAPGSSCCSLIGSARRARRRRRHAAPITVVIVVFFVLLLLVLFGLSLLVGRLGRAASRRRRVTDRRALTSPPAQPADRREPLPGLLGAARAPAAQAVAGVRRS